MCVGVPGQIVAVTDAANLLATVQIGGVRREINIACVVTEDRSAESYVGEWVLVHVGFAMSHLDEAEARATLELLQELGESGLEASALQAGP